MASGETVKDVFEKEINGIQQSDESLAIQNVQRHPFTESLTQSVHAWQGEQQRGRGGREKNLKSEIERSMLGLGIS